MRKILLADEDPTIRSQIATALRHWGYLVEAVATSTEALTHIAAANPPNLILISATLPELDGYAVCQRIRQRLAEVPIPIILLSSANDDEVRFKGTLVGISSFLRKPILLSDLIERVHYYAIG